MLIAVMGLAHVPARAFRRWQCRGQDAGQRAGRKERFCDGRQRLLHAAEGPKCLIAVEAAWCGVNSGMSAATTQLGTRGILHGSKSFVMQTEDGQVVEPHSISAGLDYPGIGPLHAHLFQSGRGQFLCATDEEALNASFEVARLEGIIPALETGHAFAALKKLALKAADTVVICLSGRGDKDLATYMRVMEERQLL